MPADAKLIFCGVLFASLTSSATEFTGTLLLTISADGDVARPAIASYCFSGSNGDCDFLYNA